MHHRLLAPPAGFTRRAILGGLPLAALGGLSSVKAAAQALSGAPFYADSSLVPNASEDQSGVLIRALQKAEAESRPLFLPPGRYEVADVTLPARTHLIGVPGRTQLVFRGGRLMLRAQHARALRLEGITLDGAALPIDPDTRALFEAEDIGDVTIDDCRVVASGGAGVWLREAAGRVTHTEFSNIGTIGIDVDQSRGMEVMQNRVIDCGDTGILVERDEEGTDDSIVSGNRVSRIRADSGGSGQNGNGINLDKANGMIIADNRVDDCAFSAIRCYSSDNVSVTGNVATRSGETGLYVEFAFEGAVVADNLIDGATDGISFANFMDDGGRLATCSGNLVRNISGGPQRDSEGRLQPGAGIAAEADVAISGNVVEDAVWGLQLGWGPYLRDVSATGNVVRRTRVGIAVSVVEGGGPALISGNVISKTERGGIVGTRWHDIATGELGDGAESAPGITVSGNQVSS